MKAETCSQCGGLIKNVSPNQTIFECEYCGAKDVKNEIPALPVLYLPSVKRAAVVVSKNQTSPFLILLIVAGAVGCFLLAGLAAASRSSVKVSPKPSPTATIDLTLAPTPKMNDDTALAFGGKGGSAGLFENANAVAVGKDGNIYVADKTMRVQRFDENGKYLNAWIVKGEKNETIDKLAASTDGSVYVLIGGEIIVYVGETGKQLRVLSDRRRHYISDFALREGGEMTYVAESETGEEFVQTKGKEIVKRFEGIHSRAAEAKIPTAGIKIAVGGGGDFFSVFAVSSLNGIFQYNDEDLMTFHFAENGKFVNKFAAGLMPLAILADSQNRAYILTRNEIAVFSSDGAEAAARLKIKDSVNAFAIDAQNNIYTVSNDAVRRLKPFVF